MVRHRVNLRGCRHGWHLSHTPPERSCIVISVQNLELRAGARLLMEEVTFRIDKGDKIGLVGRNGAGKTTWRLITPLVVQTVDYAQKTGDALAARGLDE